MTGLYARWIDRWERKLATRDTNRVVRPLEWGTEWLHTAGFPECPAAANGTARDCVSRFVTDALSDSERFYAYSPPEDYQLRDGLLTFTSPVRSPYPKNDRVHALWFPASRHAGR